MFSLLWAPSQGQPQQHQLNERNLYYTFLQTVKHNRKSLTTGSMYRKSVGGDGRHPLGDRRPFEINDKIFLLNLISTISNGASPPDFLTFSSRKV